MGTYIAIAVIAGIVNLIAFIWLVVVGFQRSVLWGILVFLFSPLAALIFAIMYWYDAKKPFLLYIVTTVAMIVPLVMMFSELDTEQLAQVVEGIESGEIKPNEAFESYGKLDDADQGVLPPDAMTEGEAMAMGETPLPMEAGTESLPATAAAVSKVDEEVSAESNTMEDTAAQQVQPEQEVSQYPSPGLIKPDPLAVKKPKVESPTIRVKLANIANYKGRYFIITTKDGNQHRGLLRKVSENTLFLSRKLYGGNFEYQVARKKVTRVDMYKEEYVKEFMER